MKEIADTMKTKESERNRGMTDFEKELSRHPSIHKSGTVRGMIKCGYWKKGDKIIRYGDYWYNLSILIYAEA